MKVLILLCLIGAAYCSPTKCHTHMEEDQYKIVVDGMADDMGQIECVHNLIKNNGGKIREVQFNIGDKTGNTKTTIKGDWIKKMMHAFDLDDHVDRIDMHIYHVEMDGNTDDLVLDHFRSLRIYLHHEDDCTMIEKLMDHITVKNLERFTMYTNTEHEPEHVFKFLTKNMDHLRHVKLNSQVSDMEMNRDRFWLKLKDMDKKMDTKDMEEVTKLGKHFREQGKFREVWIFCGNTVHDFDYVFKGNVQLRKIDTNMDVTLLDNFNYKNVWLLNLHNRITNENIMKWNQRFPNTKLICLHDHNDVLTATLKTQIQSVFKHVDRTLECKKF